MHPASTRCRIRVRMSARPIDEPHRVASQLELLFDLTFVVAVAAVTAQLAHSIADGHALAGIVPFLQVFFAIWWAWMNFTWFASSYDTDDVAYRLLTMVQMAGVLVLAAGVPAAADHSDYRAITLGYVIMRIALVAQWLRAGVEDPASRRTALRYAAGISIAQAGWLLRLLWPRQVPCRQPASCRSSWDWSSWSSPYPAGRNGPGPRTGTRTTSPSATACSRSSCSAKASSPRAEGSKERSKPPKPAVLSSSWPSPVSSCCSPSGGCTSSHRPATVSAAVAIGPTCGDTDTTASSRPWQPSAPAWRSQPSRPATTSRRHPSPFATPSPSRPRCSSSCSG